MSDIDNYKEILDREKELASLYERMSIDAKKLDSINYRYVMGGITGGNKGSPVDGVVNVTANFPLTFMDDISTLLLNTEFQKVVEGYKNNRQLKPKEMTNIELFLNIHDELIDDLLSKSGEPEMLIWLSRHICHRGWVGAVYFPYVENGQYYPLLKMIDMRYVAYVYGQFKLGWVSNRTWRTKSQIENEYPEMKGKVSQDSGNAIVARYDDKYEEVYLAGGGEEKSSAILVSRRPHMFGEVPAIIQCVPVGTMFRDRNYLSHEGESIFYLDRLLYDEANRQFSIEATMSMKSVLAPRVHEVADEGGEPQGDVDIPGQNLPVRKGEIPVLVEQPDLNMGARLARTDILTMLQQGGRNIDIGNIEALSAVAIVKVEEIRQKVLIPRQKGIASFKQQLDAMKIRFFLKVIEKAKISEIGLPGKKRAFTADDLAGDYSIRYRFMNTSKQMKIANLAIASAAKAINIPEEIIVRDILLAEKPEEILIKMASEKAEIADPVIGLMRLALKLIDEAEDLSDEEKDAKLMESIMVTERGVQILRARQNGQMVEEPGKQENKGSTQPLLPLLAGGNRGMPGNGNRQPGMMPEETEAS